jgi:hypothetical protein
MIEQLADFPDDVLGFVWKGQVTRKEYDKVVLPAVADALKKYPKVRIYYEVAKDFTGAARGAVWDDFAFGIDNFTRWDRVAVVTDAEGFANAARLYSFILPCTVRSYPIAETAAARAWIAAAA